jgi:phospholipase/carboxylesterase
LRRPSARAIIAGHSDPQGVNVPSSLGLLHVTRAPRATGNGPHPGLLLLHGRGADEKDLLGVADELDPRLFVVSVRAPLRLGPGYAWYNLLDIGNPELASFQASLDALTQFVDELPLVYPIDRTRIYPLGFSQGAVMASSLLLAHPKKSAGTIILSGYLPLDAGIAVNEKEYAGRKVFVAHGTLDPVIPVVSARLTRDFLTRVNAALTYREYTIPHYIGPQELIDVSAWLGGVLGQG